MSAELIVSHLRKQFLVGRPAVDDVSFRIAAGEIVVLLGPSGCGKTTTLRCIAGLEHPTGGTISIGGDTVAAPESGVHVPPRLRNIGMVFQSYAVWPHMTVTQNVNYPLRHRKVPRDEAARQVARVLEMRRIPHLTWVYDDSIEKAADLDLLIREARMRDKSINPHVDETAAQDDSAEESEGDETPPGARSDAT